MDDKQKFRIALILSGLAALDEVGEEEREQARKTEARRRAERRADVRAAAAILVPVATVLVALFTHFR
jgi:hypothetical protein